MAEENPAAGLTAIEIDRNVKTRCTNPVALPKGRRCTRAFFFGKLAPGTAIELKCPVCGFKNRYEVL